MRDHTVDRFKLVLLLGMYCSHSLRFFPETPVELEPLKLVTYSGFLLSFGVGCYHAYFRKPWKSVGSKMWRTAGRILLAYYVVGLASDLAFGLARPESEYVLDLLLLRRFPGFTEFLLSYSLIALLGWLLFPLIKWTTAAPLRMLAGCSLCMLTTMMPDQGVSSSHLSLVIGRLGWLTFPILPYLPVFLSGVYLGRHKGSSGWRIILVASGASLLAAYLLHPGPEPPQRFPPSASWLLASLAATLLYYRASCVLPIPAKTAEFVGRRTLYFFALGHLLLFAIKGRVVLPVWGCCLLGFGIMAGLFGLAKMLDGNTKATE